MVDKNKIREVLNNILTDYNVKCGPSIGEMKQSLSGTSHDMHYGDLMDKGLLNPLESKDYVDKLDRLNSINRWLDHHPEDSLDEMEKGILDERDYLEEELFQYNRRLIEGREMELPTMEINRDDYVSEGYSVGGVTQTIGKLERSQINSQQDSVHVDPDDLSMINIGTDDNPQMVPGKLNDTRLVAMNNYFNGDVEGLNYWISHKGYLNKLTSEQRKSIEKIDSLMEESPGLMGNTVLYRGGYFDIHTRVGDSISFKGYTSTSFSRATAESYNEDKENSMTYIIHAPKGTKGIVGNDNRFDNGQWEHEYVLPRNTKMQVVSIDYESMTVEVAITGVV